MTGGRHRRCSPCVVAYLPAASRTARLRAAPWLLPCGRRPARRARSGPRRGRWHRRLAVLSAIQNSQANGAKPARMPSHAMAARMRPGCTTQTAATNFQDTDRDSGNEIRNVDDRSGIEVAENLAAGKMSAPAPRTAYHPRATLSVKDREGVHNTRSTCRTCGATAAESLAVFTRRLPSVIVPLASMKTAVRCRTSGPSRGTDRRFRPGDPRRRRGGTRSALRCRPRYSLVATENVVTSAVSPTSRRLPHTPSQSQPHPSPTSLSRAVRCEHRRRPR